jgi:excisionase family DNA binding protein
MKEYISIEELSEYIGIKKSTLYATVANGQIPFYRIGRLIRFKKTEIDHWLGSLRQEPTCAMNGRSNDGKIRTPAIHRKAFKNTKGVEIDAVIRKAIDTTR